MTTHDHTETLSSTAGAGSKPNGAHGRDPDTIALFRALPRRAQHQFLQLAIDAMELYGPAERAADSFLAITAWEVEQGDLDRADQLYPQGCSNRAIWLRHNADLARDLVHYERCLIGRVAMLTPFARVADIDALS